MKRMFKKSDYIVIIIIVAVFMLIIGTNVSLIFGMISRQTEDIGEIQLESIKDSLQETLTEAENSLMGVLVGAEQLINKNASKDEIGAFIRKQKADQYKLTNGLTFNVYIAGHGWEIIPDFDMPADYHATERNWYIGAFESDGSIYITEPYIDSMTGEMCYTMSVLLSDKDTVIAMDFTLSGVQKLVTEMSGKQKNTSMIVTNSGKIVGYKDMELAGKNIGDALPDYQNIFNQVAASKNHYSFKSEINKTRITVFSSETGNGWYLILCVDNKALYADSYKQLVINIIVNLIMVSAIVILYVHGVKNRYMAENALNSKNQFFDRLSNEINEPIKKILKLSNTERLKNSMDPAEDMADIRESGLQLSRMMENLFSYSGMVIKERKDKIARKSEEKKKDISSYVRRGRNIMVALLIGTVIGSIVFSYVFGSLVSHQVIYQEIDEVSGHIDEWAVEQKSILGMYSNFIASKPELMDDYDEAVAWLDDIAKNYPEISVCYLANPYREHTVIMNNGWQPDEGWKVEERQWYIDTEKSADGFNISAPYLDDQTGNYCITFSKVVYGKNGEFLGLFGIDFFMDKLINVLGESYSNVQYAFLVDANGDIINHPNSEYQMSLETKTNIADTEYRDVSDYKKGKNIRDYNGVYSIVASEKNKTTGFDVYFVGNWRYFNQKLVSFSIAFVAMLVLCIVVTILLVNKIIRWHEDVNKKLSEAAKNATDAGKAKSQFLAQMSHEIRTPINAVIGMDEMILRESNEPEIREYASNIQSAGRNLLNIVNEILDFSKIEEGKMEIIPVRYELLDVVNDMVTMISDKAEKKGLELKLNIDPGLPKSLFGDDVRLRQIIINLLTNAVKYTDKGFIRLSMSGKSEGDDEFSLKVEIRDTGIGIKQEDMERLFTSFQRLDVERNRNIEGTGLGISIVQALLNMMGSKLEVNSTYGEGSLFSFTLKQRIVDSSPIGAFEYNNKTGREEQEEEYLFAEGVKVLVVDDNDMNLKVAKGLMKRCGIVPDLAESGHKCIEMLTAYRYDLIFLDHMMPGLDGIETLKRIREKKLVDESDPIIALTANAIVGIREFYIENGFTDYLSKPIEVRELEKILLKYLPEDRVKMIRKDESKDSEAREKKDTPEDPLQILKEAGIDTEKGIEYSAFSEEFYFEMIKTFTDGYAKKADEIKKDFENEDWNDYRIKVHALKSTARTLGADTLGELAFAQETAAKEERIADIRSGIEELLESYEKTVNTMTQALSAQTEQEGKQNG